MQILPMASSPDGLISARYAGSQCSMHHRTHSKPLVLGGYHGGGDPSVLDANYPPN